MLDDDLEAAERREARRDGVDLRGMDEDALDLPDDPHLPDERDPRRGIAAGARPGDEPVRVPGRVADEREGMPSELRRDELADLARPDGLTALRIEELAEEILRMEMHAVVHATLARDGTDLRLADVIEELDAERRLQIAPERGGQRLGSREADAVAEVAA